MHIRHVKVVNAGPFSKFETDLKLGSIGIFGSNGSGKTTLIRMVHAALTRKLGMFPGVKADIQYSEAKSAPSYVDVSATVDSTSFEISLSFRDRKTTEGYSRLKVQGEKEITSESDIVARLSHLGVTPGLLDTSGFVYDVFAFLDMTDAKRADFYRFLCGVEKAAVVHKILRDARVIERHEDFITGQENEILKMLAETNDRIAGYEERLARATARCFSDEKMTRIAKKLEAYDKFVNHGRSLNNYQRSLQLQNKQIAGSVRKLRKLRSSSDELEVEVEKLREESSSASQTIASYEKHKSDFAKKCNLIAEKEQLEKVLRTKKPAEPEGYETLHTLDIKLDRLETNISHLNERRRLLTGEATNSQGICPTCEQPVTNAEEVIFGIDESIETLKQSKKKLGRDRITYSEYVVKLQAYNSAREKAENRLIRVDEQLEVLQDVEQPAAVSDLVAKKDAFTQADLQLKRYRKDLAEGRAELKLAKQARDKLASRVESLSTWLTNAAPRFAEEAMHKLERTYKHQQDIQVKIAQIHPLLDAMRNDVSSLTRRLNQVRKEEETQVRARSLAALYSRGAELMHWSALPSEVVSRTLQLLSGSINESLKLFNSPFEVSANENMSFEVLLPGTTQKRSVGWLSKGQRVILAVAFWASASLFDRSPGLLVLDEPTANLDADNVIYLGEALQLLRGSVRDSRQIIMTSHAHGLKDSFDQIIELGQ